MDAIRNQLNLQVSEDYFIRKITLLDSYYNVLKASLSAYNSLLNDVGTIIGGKDSNFQKAYDLVKNNVEAVKNAMAAIYVTRKMLDDQLKNLQSLKKGVGSMLGNAEELGKSALNAFKAASNLVD